MESYERSHKRARHLVMVSLGCSPDSLVEALAFLGLIEQKSVLRWSFADLLADSFDCSIEIYGSAFEGRSL